MNLYALDRPTLFFSSSSNPGRCRYDKIRALQELCEFRTSISTEVCRISRSAESLPLGVWVLQVMMMHAQRPADRDKNEYCFQVFMDRFSLLIIASSETMSKFSGE